MVKMYMTNDGVRYALKCHICKKHSHTTDKQTARMAQDGTLPWACRNCSKKLRQIPDEEKKSLWQRILRR